jgi:hypothetical protein
MGKKPNRNTTNEQNEQAMQAQRNVASPVAVVETETVDTLEQTDGIDNPNVSNPGESTPADTDNLPADTESPGNTNGNSQSETIELPPVPTAMDTVETQLANALAIVAGLEQKKLSASVIDRVLVLINETDDDELKTAIGAVDGALSFEIMLTDGVFRYASTVGRTTVIKPPSAPTASTSNSPRTWFTKLISPDGIEHDAPMKSDVSNDVAGMETITGFVLARDGNNNSTSTIGKQNILKKQNWTYKTATNALVTDRQII